MAYTYPPTYPPYFVPAAAEIDNRPFMEKYKYLLIGVGVLIMLIVLGLIIRAIIKAAENYNNRTKAPAYQMITNPETGEIQVVNDPLEGYDPMPLAVRLKEAFGFSWLGWAGVGTGDRCDTTFEANNLSTNKLIAVAIQYKKLTNVSLYSTLENSYFDGCWTVDYSYVLRERLRQEKLT